MPKKNNLKEKHINENEIANSIIKKTQKIKEAWEQENHFDNYICITKNYKKNNINEEFKQIYTKFWLLGDHGRFNANLKEKYFELLSQKEDDLEKILKKLKKIPPHFTWLAYSTKLVHTINNNKPIYDSNIKNILELPPTNPNIENALEIYNELNKKYKILLQNKKIKEIISDFKKYLKNKYKKDSKLISDVKLLDSILWVIVKIKS